MSHRTKPPFRADHVGSFLRPAVLLAARERFSRGEIDALTLRQVEDEAIREVVKFQQDLGLQAITDGEYRRAWWHYDFLGLLGGVKLESADQGIQFKGVQTKAQVPMIRGKDEPFHHTDRNLLTRVAAPTPNPMARE